jgi:hypothetical protein
MSALTRPLDTFSRVTPLGLRFWDAVLEMVVGDGLTVTAYPEGQGFRRTSAFTTPGGVYGFAGLPGLHAAETGAGDDAYWTFWTNPAQAQRFVVEVSDPAGRYQPFSLTTDLPRRGLYTWDCTGLASPLASPVAPGPPAVPLFSAPGRAVPAGMAVVRAELWDVVAGAPAAWAVLEVTPLGQPPAQGIADAAGRVAVLFPYPEPAMPPVALGSPLGGSAGSLAQQQWTVALRAAYTPRPPSSTPDLCATLSQPAAFLWADTARSQPRTEAQLFFGQELVVRTKDSATGARLPTLYVTTAASPP